MTEIRHNEARHRFEAGSAAHMARLDYRLRDGVVDIVHTEVPYEYRGQGIAGRLTAAALEWARASGRKVIPSCPYVGAYIAKHPEFSHLL